MLFFNLGFLFLSFIIIGIFAIYKMPAMVWAIFFITTSSLLFKLQLPSFYTGIFFLFCVLSLISLFLAFPFTYRRLVHTIFRLAKKAKVHTSDLEKQAIDAGNAGFEAGFFAGKPDWSTLQKLPVPELTDNETLYLKGTIHKLCAMTDDWEVRQQKNIPEPYWDFAKKNKLSGLRVAEKWGGAGFSFYAQSHMLSTVASRSVDVSTLLELPTSLYPDEIIEEYGTEEQKRYYLPRLAQGEEIVSFAVTGEQGSDVGNMPDTGIVTYGQYNGKRVLGIKITFKKRYITFAPKASLIVLAFSLTDPDRLLEKDSTTSITLALIPANHPGITRKARHFPTSLAFPHGPIEGSDVFIPIEWIVGGSSGVGLGWKMITQCLFLGRCLALPSISVGTIQTAFKTTTAYAQVRRQFGLPINTFEGVKESITKLAELSYISESARVLASTMVDSKYRSLTISAIMKYKITEYAKEATNHALAVHGGKGVCDGPSNYLLSGYFAVPIGTTVEGANIVTRSIITFAQGSLQSHPHLRQIIESCEDVDEKRGLHTFADSVSKFSKNLLANIFRSVFHGVTSSYFADFKAQSPTNIRHYYRNISRYSASFAVITDITIMCMGVELKKQQMLGGRLADVVAELYLLSSILKRFENDGCPDEDYPIVLLCMENGLYRIEKSLLSAIQNYPLRFLRPILKCIIFPVGSWRKPACDTLIKQVSELVSRPNKTRARLSNTVYASPDVTDVTNRLEVAFKAAVAAEPIYKKLREATRRDVIKKSKNQIEEALAKNILSFDEVDIVYEAENTASFAVSVDSFPLVNQ